MGRNNRLGAWGEALAANYLRRKHYTILASNFRIRMGEIDLIAADRRYLVFVEVKLRKNADFAMAREYVDYKKHHPTDLQPRFDVIEIYAPEGMETHRPTINHLEDAFQ